MTQLSTNQRTFIKTMTEDEEYERRGFELLVKRPDMEIFFDPLAQSGLFDPSHNVGPIEDDRPGYYRLPYWSALGYLEAVAKRAGENDDIAIANKVMNVIRQVSQWRDKYGSVRDNDNTWHSFAMILGLVPMCAVSLDDIDLIPVWFEGRFNQSRVSSAFANGPLGRFVASESPADWSKACRILYHCTAIRRRDGQPAGRRFGKTVATVADDFWLKELIKSSATALGMKAGKDAATVFLTRLHDLVTDEMSECITYLSRPAIEDHAQNHFDAPLDRFVEGLRDVLLAWVDHDIASAQPFIEQLLRDETEIVRRIAIYVLNERFASLRRSVPLLCTPEIFDMGHLHELYVLLKAHFQEFTEEEKAATLAAIRSLPLPESASDPLRLLRHEQRRWLSAIAGHGYDPADQWLHELMSDSTLGGLSPHPDFHSYMEAKWGFGGTPHSATELVAFAEAGELVPKLNAFVPGDSWDGPTTRSLVDSVIEAVGFAPQIFLARLPSFLDVKCEYQYAVIAGFKKLWDAWDGKEADFDWNDAWPKLIEFFEKIVSDQDFWSEPVTETGPSPNRNWIPPVISEFLRAGTRRDEKAYAPELLSRTWSLTKILLRESEPQEEPSEGDALNVAINTPRGKAVEALFDHALRWSRVSDHATGAHAETWHNMEAVFDEEVAACRNKNFEFSAVAGAYITNLHYLNSDWLHNNFRRIFPIDFPANCLSALDGLSFAPATPPIYRELVDTGVFEWAMNHEMKRAQARENLVQRMCLACLWDEETLESSRFALLFNLNKLDDLEVACKYFWAIRDQPLSDDQKERIIIFLERSVSWTMTVQPVPARILSVLSRLICYLESMEDRQLKILLAVAPHVSIEYNADYFIKELGRLVEINPQEVGEVLVVVLETYQASFDFEDRLKKLVMKLAEQPATKSSALRCAERLRQLPGMVQLYEQLISDSKNASQH